MAKTVSDMARHRAQSMPSAQSGPSILFWDACIQDPNLGVVASAQNHRYTTQYNAVIKDLFLGNVKQLDLKRFKAPCLNNAESGYGSTGKLWTARLGAHRLLFTVISQFEQGVKKHSLLLLEFIENHDYQKSRFLKPGVLNRYLEARFKNPDDFVLISEADFESVEKEDEEVKFFTSENFGFPEGAVSFSFKPASYFRNKYICLSELQSGSVKALYEGEGAAILQGAAGTGKSLIAQVLFFNRLSRWLGLQAKVQAVEVEGCEEKKEKDAEAKLADDITPSMLYISTSHKLVRDQQTSFENAYPEMADKVDFLTYRERFKPSDAQALERANASSFVSESNGLSVFKKWLFSKDGITQKQDNLIRQFGLKKTVGKKKKDFESEDLIRAVYEECRICLGCDTLESYCQLPSHKKLFTVGERLSNDTQVSEKMIKTLWEAYQAYRQFCQSAFQANQRCASNVIQQSKNNQARKKKKQKNKKKNKKGKKNQPQKRAEQFSSSEENMPVDWGFYTHKQKIDEQYDFIVVDEGQDFSLLQITQIHALLKKGGKIVFCIDTLQCLNLSISPLDCLKSYLFQKAQFHSITHNQNVPVLSLDEVFRMPADAVQVANNLLALKRQLIKGTVDSGEGIHLKSVGTSLGTVAHLPIREATTQFESIGQSLDYAVIVSSEANRKEAERLFDTPLIFTIEEIKGLEFKNIILYKIFEGEDRVRLEEIDRLIHLEDKESRHGKEEKQDKVNRPKYKREGVHLARQYAISLNRLFVAITRTQSALFFVHEKAVCLNFLRRFVKEMAPVDRKKVLNKIDKKANTREEHLAFAQMLRADGKIEQASKIEARWGHSKEAEKKEWEEKDSYEESALKGSQKNHYRSRHSAVQRNRRIKMTPLMQTEAKNLHDDFEGTLKRLCAPGKNRKEKLKKTKFLNRLLSSQPGFLKEKEPNFLYYLFSRKRYMIVFREFLKTHYAVIFHQAFSGDLLCAHQTVAGSEEENMSVLSYLSGNALGHEILQTLLEGNALLATQITAESLMRARTQAAGEDENISALYWLVSVRGIGQNILKKLLEANPELKQQITGAGLMRACVRGSEENASVLYWLAASGETGHALFRVLLEGNSKLAKEITGEGLMRARTQAAGEQENTSVLSFLATCETGRSILKTLLENNSKLAAQITGEGLMRASPEAIGVEGNMSALYCLSGTRQGRIILKTLLATNKKLAEQITGESLMCARTQAAGKAENTSALYSLSSKDENGHTIFMTLLNNNPRLAKQITGEGLMRARTQAAGEFEKTSPLYYLAHHHGAGHSIFLKLLDSHPELATQITGESLMCARTSAAGEFENVSALYWLSASETGHSILKILLEKNPNLAKQITGEGLMRARTQRAGWEENISALYCLAATEQSQSVLRFLLESNKELTKQITMEGLLRARTQAAGEYANTSALGLLLSTEMGHIVLKILIKNNTQLEAALRKKKCLPFFLLEGAGQEVERKQEEGPSDALLFSFQKKRLVKALLVEKCNPNLNDRSEAIVQALLLEKIDPNVRINFEQICGGRQRDVTKKREGVVCSLLESKANVMLTKSKKITPYYA